jgi:hypothetical protein
MFESVIIAALAASYFIFIYTAKDGPGSIFRRVREAILSAGIPFFSHHLVCPTCLALSVGLASYLVLQTPFAFVVHVFAVAGAVHVLHGMAGYWHQRDG